MLVKRMHKTNKWVVIVVVAIAFYFGLRVGTVADATGGKVTLEAFQIASDQLFSFEPIRFTKLSLMLGGFLGLFAWMVIETFKGQTKKNMQENAFGSAKWEDPNYTKKMRENDYLKDWIMTKTEIVSKDMTKTDLNRNVFVCGASGRGKSRFWLKPNLLSVFQETVLITDPKEELLVSCGQAMIHAGMDIRVLNIDNKWRSNGYNPFKYIRHIPKEAILLDVDSGYEFSDEYNRELFAEDDVMTLINAIIQNTKSETIESNTGDPFWEKAEMVFLQALFYYIIYNYEMKDRNFSTLLELMRMGEPDKDGNSELRMLFDAWEMKDPENIGVKQWKHFIVSAKTPKTMSTIILTASARFAPFNLREIEWLMKEDTIELDRIGKRGKEGHIAYFVITRPNDPTFNFIANLFYTQAFNMIEQNAKENGGVLATPCTLYLDEFRQMGVIPRFLENQSYVRGLNAGICTIVQGISSIKKMFKEEWETLIDNCDYFLFLGSQSKETLEYVSNAVLGKQTLYKKSQGRTYSKQGSSSFNWDSYGRELATIDEIKRLKKGHAIFQMAGGAYPFYSELYDLKKHPRYSELFEPRIEERGLKDPNFKDTKEWKENHAKRYDHLTQKGSLTTEQRQQKLIDTLGVRAKVNAPFKMRVVSDFELQQLMQEDGVVYSSNSSATDLLLS